MKRVFQFSRGYVPAVIASTAIIALGLVGFLVKGFNLGIDFQAGINQTVQLAYPAVEITYAGKGNAVLTVGSEKATIVFSGAEVENKTVDIDFKAAPTLGAVVQALKALPDVSATLRDVEGMASTLLVPTFQGDTRLGPSPVLMHRAPANEEERFASIEKVRAATTSLGRVSVQAVNPASLQRFLIRAEDDGKNLEFSKAVPATITAALEKAFGAGRVVVMKTDYVGARYSETLTRQTTVLFLLTVLVILIYATFRFGFQYGFGAVLATVHDALIIICFVVWTRMEFTTSTIAAVLTILGYSINDTIVQFDRVREDRKLRPTEKFKDVLNGALSETLGRTIITTLCTMIAVLAIFFFTSGSLKDFALALFVGMISGTYSTIYIASAFVLWWENKREAREAAKLALQDGAHAAAKAAKVAAKALKKQA
jgi:preprotein translocase subunit SecF